MKAYHLHLAINHLPLVALPLLTLMLLIFRKMKNPHALRTTLVFLIILGLSTLLIYLSGQLAEDSLKGIRTIEEPLIAAHEEAGELALYFSLGLSLIAALALFYKKHSDILINILIAISILTCILIARTSYLGGMLSHPELLGTHKNEQ